MEVLIWTIGLVASFIAGIVTAFICRGTSSSGTVEIDRTDPEIPYLRLNLDENQLDKLHTKKYVLFKVDPDASFTRQKQSL